MPSRGNLGEASQEVGVMKKIYILHGWSYNTVRWKNFNRTLKDEGFQPVMFKIPGLTQPIQRPWTLEDYVEWLAKELPKEKVILLGHSNGGRISIAFALKYPQRVDHLILIDSAGIYHKEFTLQLKRLILTGMAKIGKKVTNSPRLKNILYKIARETDYKNADEIMKETMINLMKVDLTPRLKEIKIPTIIIWGENDRVVIPADGILMKKEITNSQFYIVESARHSPQFTHPETVVDIVVKNL